MLLASILLIIAISGGTLLTFIYDQETGFATRLCIGSSNGLPLLATAGFLFSWWIGLNATSISLSAALLLLPWCVLLNRRHRAAISATTSAAIRTIRNPDRANAAYLLFYAAMAVLLGVVFARAFVAHADGIYTGVLNNLGDFPLHLQIISSFVQGQNFHAEDPIYAGVRFTYPLLADFLSAMLLRVGASLAAALWLPAMVLGMALVGLLHYWTILLTRNRLAGLIAPLLVVFSGGLGWLLIFDDVHNSDHGLLPLLAHLPHDYTILPGGILRWGNALTTLFVPQRSLLFGLPLAISIFCQWWMALESSQTNSRSGASVSAGDAASTSAAAVQAAPDPSETMRSRLRMAAAGFFAGLMPLVHAHTFGVIAMVAVALALIFRSHWRSWLVFFTAMIVIATPEGLWLLHTGAKAQKFVGWQIGWDRGNHDPLLFWLANTGLFMPLLIAAVVVRRPEWKISRRVLLFLSPFLLCFIIPNITKLAPWIWDNIKVLIYWYVASVPLVAWFLARWLQQKPRQRWMAAAVLASLLFSGTLDVLRVVTRTTEFKEFDANGISIARLISQIAPPQAVVLHAPVYNSPVFLTGRRSLLGYPGWLWSRGIDYSQRERDVHDMYLGNSDTDDLLKRYRVDYVLLGPQERNSLIVNEPFWEQYPLMAHIGDYFLYKVDGPR